MTTSTRNKTITLSPEDKAYYSSTLMTEGEIVNNQLQTNCIQNKIINGDMFSICPLLEPCSVDLLFLDPPYNMSKKFGHCSFSKTNVIAYSKYLDSIIKAVIHTLKPNATIYICGDWLSSASVFEVASRYFHIQNRITWGRDKGRGAKTNWKNSHEDIWFCTMSNDYIFNVEDVKIKKKVIAPYKKDGEPKDWFETPEGKFRYTYPSNFWKDMVVPFWSMPENTEHPTQKPEKLIERLLLASTNENDLVLDPFVGSGTTAVVAKRLWRNFIGIELDINWASIASKRLKELK